MSKQNYAQHETVTIEGVDYVSPDSCSFGDYGGAGAVGLSNIRCIIEEAKESVFETDFQTLKYASEGSYFPFEDEHDLRDAVKARRKPLVLHVTGSYGSESVYILRHSKLAHETLSALASYCSLDDDSVSHIEMEWESEAWESWIESDLNRKCWPDENPAGYDEMSNSDKFSAYRFAMDIENEYPVSEYSGVHVDVDQIADSYRATIERMLSGESIDAIQRKQWPKAYGASA